MNIILSHGGWPWVTEAIHVAYRYKNVYLLPDLYQFNGPGRRRVPGCGELYPAGSDALWFRYPMSPAGAVDYFLEGR